jgi:hypothetical protein
MTSISRLGGADIKLNSKEISGFTRRGFGLASGGHLIDRIARGGSNLS